jgi:hypothetical protein
MFSSRDSALGEKRKVDDRSALLGGFAHLAIQPSFPPFPCFPNHPQQLASTSAAMADD